VGTDKVLSLIDKDLPFMSKNESDAGYIIDKDILDLTGADHMGSGIELISGGSSDGEDSYELENDIKKMEKMLRKHEKPTSIMWTVPTIFTEFYHEFIKKDEE
jgi:hypothetical protein